jgi:CRP-like cAMP-binding protein
MAYPNRLLAMLPDHDQLALSVHLRPMDLNKGAVLAEPDSEIRNVYFPHSGIVSFMVGLEDGALVQTLMVGRDGVIGAAQALDTKTSVNTILVQVSGIASVIDRDPLREIVESRPKVRSLLAAHAQFLVADIQQTAACNARHSVESRMAKWIMRMRDLVGDDLPLTQDNLASMIGVRRSSVARVAAFMQAAGAISYSRGRVQVIDPHALLRLSCECHDAVRKNYSNLLGTPGPA